MDQREKSKGGPTNLRTLVGKRTVVQNHLAEKQDFPNFQKSDFYIIENPKVCAADFRTPGIVVFNQQKKAPENR